MSSVEIQKQIAELIKKINFYRNHPEIKPSILDNLKNNLETTLQQLIQSVEGK